MANEVLPCPTLLRQLLSYDPETGKLSWNRRQAWMFNDGYRGALGNCNNWNARYSGKPAFTAKMKNGYHIGAVAGRSLLAHRVIWAIQNGAWPSADIDHINGVRTDNRSSNLRSVTRTENLRNAKKPSTNTSGTIGVSWNERQKKWIAQIKIDGVGKFLGAFVDIEDAIQVRQNAERKHEFHQNHGR